MLWVLAVASAATGAWARDFIAHRGVNLRSTIAGENSVEAVELARRAGFRAIETDVRLSADDSLVVMHDATLDRTCLRADGSPVTGGVEVASLTWEQLRRDYRLRADSVAMQSRIPSLSEFLTACRDAGLYVFIEPKLTDESGRFYRRIIDVADGVFGRGNYVVTSNNRANEIIRDTLGVRDVPLMGILYQTTFDSIARLGNCIMAVSASRFADGDFHANVALSRRHGLRCESHADNFARFSKINRDTVDYVSTDFLAPDFNGQGRVVRSLAESAPALPLRRELEPSGFGGLYLELNLEGEAEITLGPQVFRAGGPGTTTVTHQVMTDGATPVLEIRPLTADTAVGSLTLRQIEY